MADMDELFGSSGEESRGSRSPDQNNDSGSDNGNANNGSDNNDGSGDEQPLQENEGSDNNDEGSGDEQSRQGSENNNEGSGDEQSERENEGSGDERSEHGNEGSGDENNEEGSGDERHSEQGDDEEEEAKRSDGSEDEAAVGSGDEKNSNSGDEKNSNSGDEKNSKSGDEKNSNSGDEKSNHSGGENSDHAESGNESEGERAEDEGEQEGSGKESEKEHSDKERQSDKEQQSDNEEHEGEGADDKNAIAEDLFGDADDISSGSEAGDKADPIKLADLEEDENEDHGEDDEEGGAEKRRRISEGEEGEDGANRTPTQTNDEEMPEEEPPPEETRIDVEIPKITTDLGKELHFVKLPNFISVETRPFDPATYEDEIDDDEVLDEEGRARLKLKVENTVRWRWGVDEDANPIKESNAKFVKWSDGSMSLHLGSEIFDVHKQLLQGDHNHLFIRQGTGLQGQAVFRTKLTFRPHSTDSFTHRKITMSVADRSQKAQKIRILPNVGKDPEAHRSEMIKKEEDRLKASIRRESKQRRMKERAVSRGLSASYLEGDRYDDDEEDDDGAISLAAIKNKFKKGGSLRENRPPIYSSDSEGSGIDERKAKRLEKAKISESDGDDSEEEMGPKKKMARIEESEEEDD